MAKLNRNAEPGADWASVKQKLFRQGYSEGNPTFGPPRDLSGWDRCLTRNIYYPFSIASGQRWICVRVGDTGKITDRYSDEYHFGL